MREGGASKNQIASPVAWVANVSMIERDAECGVEMVVRGKSLEKEAISTYIVIRVG